MLRIERNPHSRELSLSMRKRPSSIGTPELWMALGIAVAIHLAAVLLFRFPIFDFKNLSMPQPALVEAIIATDPVGEARANWIPHHGPRLLPEHLLVPRSALPALPKWQEVGITNVITSPVSNEQALFDQIEHLDLLMKPSIASLPSIDREMRIHVSGQLAAYSYTYNAKELPNIPQTHYRFDVKVDATTGRICWAHPINTDNPLTLQSQALGEQILSRIRFQKHPAHILTSGEIEITFGDEP